MSYLISHICEIVDGSLKGETSGNPIEYLLTDSRRLLFPATSLFIALPGPRRDGHDFIDELYQRGVRNYLVYRVISFSSFPEAAFILVSDSVDALQRLTAYHRKQFDIPVIGITGSNGKTIVKEWLNQLLEQRFILVRSPKSYNSQVGVPLSVWQMNATHELGIFEAGISQPGEMEKLERVIAPTLGIFTNIGEAHAEGFTHLLVKIQEKSMLFQHAHTVIYPADDPQISIVLQKHAEISGKQQLIGWGQQEGASLVYRVVQQEELHTTLNIHFQQKEFHVLLPFTDKASLENCVTCITTLLSFGCSAEYIQAGMRRLFPVAMRLELKSGINQCTIINDSYSADLSSLKIALDFLVQQHLQIKRTVILSDFLQSGKEESDLYAEIGRLLKQKNISRLIGIGEKISAQAAGFEAEGITDLQFFHSTEEFTAAFHRLHFHGEIILLKGARMFGFEEIDSLLSQQVHQTVLEINLNAMAENLRQYRNLLQPSTKIMAMVKAFAYGSGIIEIAAQLQFHKVDYLAVAYADEGVNLRRGGIRLPILVMNAEESSFQSLVQHNLEPVLFSTTLFNKLETFIRSEGISLFPVHIELETGMNRLGFDLQNVPALCSRINSSPFKIQSVFSHLSSSEEAQQDAFTLKQSEKFLQAAGMIEETVNYKIIKHISNTAAISRLPQLQLDMVRLGIGLYGIDSADSPALELTEVSTLKTTIAQIRDLVPGETVGYNRKGVIDGKSRIATVRVGYADGYPRSLGNGNGKMLVKGKFAPVIGSVCMDMTMLDITGIHGVEEEDEVIVFGAGLSVSEVAHWAQTIPYEILTGISQRVKRIYYEE